MKKIIFTIVVSLLSKYTFSEDIQTALIDPKKAGFVLEQPQLDFWTKRIPKHELEASPDIGFENVKNMQIRSIAVGKGRLIWDVMYNFDEHGRRITDNGQNNNFKNFIIFSGCSFTFGTGLNGNETVPFLVKSEFKDTNVFNTAIGASGTNQMLALIKRNNFKNLYPWKKGLFVYIYIKDHIMRANALYPAMYWMGVTPQYGFVKNEFIYQGKIQDVHPYRTMFYKKVGQLFYENTIFPRQMDSHYKYGCDLVEAAKNEFERNYPMSRFVVIEHPQVKDENFAKCLKNRKITLLQYDYVRDKDDTIEGEPHPSFSFNKKWASMVSKDLKKILAE